jgi:peroxiredoxin
VRSLSSFRGRPLLLNYWTAEAALCGGELKQFQEHHAERARSGLQLAAVNLNPPAELEAVRSYARGLGLSFPVLLDTEDVAGIYNLLYRYMFDRHRDLQIPTSFLVDAEGAIVKVYQGALATRRGTSSNLKCPLSRVSACGLCYARRLTPDP